MARIVPPFGFKFWMRKMVLGEGKDFPRKGPFELLSEEARGNEKKNGKKNKKGFSPFHGCIPLNPSDIGSRTLRVAIVL